LLLSGGSVPCSPNETLCGLLEIPQDHLAAVLVANLPFEKFASEDIDESCRRFEGLFGRCISPRAQDAREAPRRLELRSERGIRHSASLPCGRPNPKTRRPRNDTAVLGNQECP